MIVLMVLDDASGQQGIGRGESHVDERCESLSPSRRVAPVRAHAYKRRGHSPSVVLLMSLGTWLFTKMRGELVGTDAEGHRYYQDKRAIAARRRKRWVIYDGVVEASRVPPEWDSWLHHTTDAVPPAGGSARKT